MAEHEKLLSDLIKIRSYSGEERQLRDFTAEWFKARGIESFVQDHNLIVHLEGMDTSRAFIFNSHLDTVNEGDTPWKYGALNPTKEGDKLVGLGASDMKSGMTTSMLLAADLAKRGKPPVDLWFTYVVNEEVDGSGTESFAEWFSKNGHIGKYKDMAAIFTEPSNLNIIEYGSRGNYFLEVTARGPSGHASKPAELKGPTSVMKIMNFSVAFREAVIAWNKEFPNSHFSPALTVGEMTSIRANVIPVAEKDKNGKIVLDAQGEPKLRIMPASVNKFPDTCIATFDLRTTLETHDLLAERVQELAKKMGVEVGNLYKPAPAGFTDPNDKLVIISQEIVNDSKIETTLGSTDLGFLSTQGIKGIILGPGVKDQEHKTDEYTLPTQIPQAVEIYRQIVEAWAK